jgi:hypothetical protein
VVFVVGPYLSSTSKNKSLFLGFKVNLYFLVNNRHHSDIGLVILSLVFL